MAEFWIRVHASLIDKPVVDRAVHALDVSEHEAIGLLVTFWGAVSSNVIGGRVGDRTDRQLEAWARWKGERGLFSKFIREQHLDRYGRVNEWEEYAGKLEQRRANERERKAQQRARTSPGTSRGQNEGRPADNPADTGRDVRNSVQPTRAVRNETLRNETELRASSSSARETSEFADLLPRIPSYAGREALNRVIDSASSPEACTTALWSMATGNDPATPVHGDEVFEHALIDFAANGDRWNAALFRKYLRRASRLESQHENQHPSEEFATAQAKNGRPLTPGEQGYLNAKAGLEDL